MRGPMEYDTRVFEKENTHKTSVEKLMDETTSNIGCC